MKRTLVVAIAVLALVAGACGDDGKSDGKLGGAAVATTPPAGTVAGTTTLDVAQAISGPTTLPVGYVTSMSIGGVALPADLPVKMPGNLATNVVGVVSTYTWSQVKTDPIKLFLRTSNAAGAAMASKTGPVVFRLSIYTPGGGSYFVSVRAARRDFFGSIATAPVVRASSGPTGVTAGRTVDVSFKPASPGTDVFLYSNATSYVTKSWASA